MKRLAPLLPIALAACQPGGDANVPGDSSDASPYSGIAEDEILKFGGTEPFWGGEVVGGTLVYTTPDDMAGTSIAVERFAGRGGLALSGVMHGETFDMMVTEGDCSDGMSDRTYPFVVTLKIGENDLQGCGWTEARPFDGPESP